MRIEPLALDQIAGSDIVCPDVESTGLHWYRDSVFGLALATYDPKEKIIRSGYWDIRSWDARKKKQLTRDLASCKRIVNHNIKFDAHMMREAGMPLQLDKVECTGVRAALIDEHRLHYSLDSLAIDHVGRGKETGVYEKLAAMFGGKPTKEVQMKNLHRAPERIAREYARTDPELAIELWLWQEEEMAKQELGQIWGLERDLTPVLIDIEHHGIKVDLERTEKAQRMLQKQADAAQRALNKAAGKEVNANSPVQMRAIFGTEQRDGKWFIGKLMLETTDGGQPSMDADAMRALEDMGHPMAKHVLDIRRATKAISFCKDHIMGHEVGGRVYPNYNQTKGERGGVGPGRLSIDDPAMQQIPKRNKEVAEIVRACFVPDDGDVWACADWEQFEFRWFAHYTKDPNILALYEADPTSDFHQMVADLTGLPRSARYSGDANAKQINLGLVFGMGPGKMAMEMGLDYTIERHRGKEWIKPGEKATAMFDKYHTAIPGVRKLLDDAGAIARSRGYVKTVMGRKIRFPRGQFTHKAGGLVFQGSSADCMKYKMIVLHRMSKLEGFRYLISVHDESDISVSKKEVKRILPMMKKELETFDGVHCPIKCRVPILSDIKYGPNWWEASK